MGRRRLYDTIVTDSNYPEPRHPINDAKPISYWVRPDGKFTWKFPKVRTGEIVPSLQPHLVHVSTNDFADSLGLSRRQIAQWCRTGKLGDAAGRVPGGHWRINIGKAMDVMRARGIVPGVRKRAAA